MNRWKPNTTVATVVTRTNTHDEEEYLLVHEIHDGKEVYNQPAGNLDKGEGLLTAAKRETLEETAWQVSIESFIGIYRFVAPNGVTYLRYAFHARSIIETENTLDEGIIEAVWLTYDQIISLQQQLRSPLVLQAINDYRSGESYPLRLLHEPQ